MGRFYNEFEMVLQQIPGSTWSESSRSPHAFALHGDRLSRYAGPLRHWVEPPSRRTYDVPPAIDPPHCQRRVRRQRGNRAGVAASNPASHEYRRSPDRVALSASRSISVPLGCCWPSIAKATHIACARSATCTRPKMKARHGRNCTTRSARHGSHISERNKWLTSRHFRKSC